MLFLAPKMLQLTLLASEKFNFLTQRSFNNDKLKMVFFCVHRFFQFLFKKLIRLMNIRVVMRNSYITGKNCRVELDIFLSSYRATPHDSTGISPAKLMFITRASSSHLPVYFKSKKDDSELEKLARINDDKAKQVMKVNLDKMLKA